MVLSEQKSTSLYLLESIVKNIGGDFIKNFASRLTKAMEDYPEELRTPPVALISLVGCQELHQMVSTHLHSQQPPINTLALPDFSKILVMEKTPKEAGDSSPIAGIIKRDWLIKHRTKVPAVVAALFRSNHISGDPAQWLQLCTDLDQLKAVIRPRNIKLVLVVVQSHSKDDINEDRMLALRKRAEVDSKHIITFCLNDEAEQGQSLDRLGSSFTELANIYYRDEGRRIKMRVEKKSFSFIELGVRYCFKVAVYAEFRRDWVEALKFYEDAYYMLREMVGTSTRLPPVQRLVEIKTVAEQLHFKISTLLLHGRKIIEAVMWFRQHFSAYRKLMGPSEVTFLHWEWISKQFLVFAELLETSSRSVPGFHSICSAAMDKDVTDWELQPAYYYQLASYYLKEKRLSFEVTLSMFEASDETDRVAESVIPSLYIGQFARLIEQTDGAVAMQSITDAEFTRYSISEGKRFQDSFEIIALLKKTFDIYSSLKAMRMAAFCGLQMAKEYFHVNDFKKAKYFFDSTVSLYRHEGWVTLMWEILGFLRECSRQDGSLKEFVEYSLEMAALPVSPDPGVDSLSYKECGPAGPPSFQQRQNIQEEVWSVLTGESGWQNTGDDRAIRLDESALLLEIDLVSPLRVALLASVAFHEQMVKPGMPAQMTLSLLSQLPNSVEIDALDIQFNQSDCNFTILNAQRIPSVEHSTKGSRTETAPMLTLVSNKWLRLTYDVQSDQSGKLECLSVIARIGSRFTICCRAESPASMGDLPLWKFEERVESFPTKDTALAFSGQKATQVDEPDPQVEVIVNASGPALVEESFIVPIKVVSKGHSVHSGELKINLVDTRGGGLVSPREMDPQSVEIHHVELIGIFGSDGEENPQAGFDNIRKIQPSFGLISVPFLKDGDTWSCKLEIKWHRPKPVMIYVSLGYSPCSVDDKAQKVHIHKSLQIEGKIPIVVSHRVMLPFQRDHLLLSRVKSVAGSDGLLSLPVDETSMLIVSAKNCTEVPLRLLSISIEADEDVAGSSCKVYPANNSILEPACSPLLVPGEEYRKVVCILPVPKSLRVNMGTFCLRWIRDSDFSEPSSTADAGVLVKHRLPDAKVEFSPLVVCFDCPPHAILGAPFTCFVRIRNQTELLQEIKLSLVDSHSFVSCGSHNDTIFVLPKSEHILSHKLVPLASGPQLLPRITLTAVRYSAGFQPSVAASTIYVFPLKPEFKMKTAETRQNSCVLAVE